MTEMMTLLLMMSAVVWYVVGRVKPIWSSLSWGKYITIGLAAVLSGIIVFTYGLDVLVALAITGNVTVVGEILSILIMMSGSSAFSELMDFFQSGASKFDV